MRPPERLDARPPPLAAKWQDEDATAGRGAAGRLRPAFGPIYEQGTGLGTPGATWPFLVRLRRGGLEN